MDADRMTGAYVTRRKPYWKDWIQMWELVRLRRRDPIRVTKLSCNHKQRQPEAIEKSRIPTHG